MALLELLALVGTVVWVAQVLGRGGRFDQAWLTLFVGVGLMLSRAAFVIGALMVCVSLGFLTLPIARAEWSRLQGERAGDRSPPG